MCGDVCAFQLGHLGDLPKEVVSEYDKNEEFLKKVHHVLMEVGCIFRITFHFDFNIDFLSL